MAYRQTVAPTKEPVARGEAKEHLRLIHDCDDATLDALVTASRTLVEHDCSRQLVTATWQLKLDKFPYKDSGILDLERPPIQSVSFVKYIDTDGAEQTLASSEYQVDTISEPGRIRPAYGKCWPATRCQLNAVTIEFVAGYGLPIAVPTTAKQMMLLLIGHWYENREAVGQVGEEIELAYCSLLYSLKWGLH